MRVQFTFIQELIEAADATAIELEDRAHRHDKLGYQRERDDARARADAFRRVEVFAIKERDRLDKILSESASARRDEVA